MCVLHYGLLYHMASRDTTCFHKTKSNLFSCTSAVETLPTQHKCQLLVVLGNENINPYGKEARPTKELDREGGIVGVHNSLIMCIGMFVSAL